MTVPNFVIVDQSFSKKTGQLPLALSTYNLPASVTTGTYIADILNVRPGLTPSVEPFFSYTVGGDAISGWTLLVGPIPPSIPTTVRLTAGGQVASYPLFPNAVSVLGTLTLSGALNNGTSTSGSILGATPGSTIVSNVTGLTVNSSLRTYSFNGSASASTVSNGLVETLAGAVGSPKNNSITVLPAVVTLTALSFASLSNPLYTGSSASGTISGATVGSTITASGLPSGFTINGAARTWAWSGSGSAATSSVSLTETLAGATNTPNVTSGLSITVAVPATLPAPVITQTSTAGSAPFAFSAAENAAYQAGMDWHVQRADSSSNLTAGILTGEAIQMIQPGDLSGTSDIIFSDLTAQAVGEVYIRLCVEYLDGAGTLIQSPWSNVLHDTLAAPVQLITGTGTGKSQYLTVTGSPALNMAMTSSIGAASWVRADTVVTGKRHFEITLGTNSTAFNNWVVGVTDSGLTLGPSTFVRPGNGTDKGCSISLGHGYTAASLYANGGYINDYATLSGGATAGDKIIVEFDTTANTVSFWHSRSGTHLLLVTVTLTSNIPTNWVAAVGGYDLTGTGDALTANLGGSFAKTPSSGYVAYG